MDRAAKAAGARPDGSNYEPRAAALLLVARHLDGENWRALLQQLQDLDNPHRHFGFRHRIHQERASDDLVFLRTWFAVNHTFNEC